MWNQQEASPRTEGARPPQPAAPATATRPGEERRVVAWVGKSVIFKGDLVSSEDMTIDGRVEGTIEVRDHSLTIGPDADIRADIVAKSVIVLGSVTGSITAHDKVDIRDTGSVQGDILAARLAMSDGAMLRGRVESGTRPGVQDGRRSQLTTA
jgi:cytoskeletal protein CcmA (bactofilin family)